MITPSNQVLLGSTPTTSLELHSTVPLTCLATALDWLGFARPCELKPVVLERLLWHRLLPLLAHAELQQPGEWLDPAGASLALRLLQRADHAARSQRAQLDELLCALAAEGIATLLLKGAALAGSAYGAEVLRPRGDDDLYVAPAQRHAAAAVLKAHGFGFNRALLEHPNVHEMLAVPIGALRGAARPVDLHWRFCEHPLLAAPLEFSAMWSSSVAISGQPDLIRRPDPADEVLALILHAIWSDRTTGSRPLIWQFDLALASSSCNHGHWAKLTQTATEQGFSSLVLAGMAQCSAILGVQWPITTLNQLNPGSTQQRLARLLVLDRSAFQRRISMLRDLPVRAASAWLWHALSPGEAYCRARYPALAQRSYAFVLLRRLFGLGIRGFTRR